MKKSGLKLAGVLAGVVLPLIFVSSQAYRPSRFVRAGLDRLDIHRSPILVNFRDAHPDSAAKTSYPLYAGTNLRGKKLQSVINEATSARINRPGVLKIAVSAPVFHADYPEGYNAPVVKRLTPEAILKQRISRDEFASTSDYRRARELQVRLRAVRINRVVEGSYRPTQNQ